MTESPVAQPSWRTWSLLFFASALATLPVWLPTFPQMVDLPQHAAQVALLDEVGRSAFQFAPLFRINWFTPYLLGYLLIHWLVPWMGLLSALKLVIALALLGVPMATALLLSEAGGDPRWALLTLPAYYGFAYHWGFLNFLVAAPLGIAFLAFVLRHARRATPMSYALLGLTTIGLFFCHAMICAFFGFLAALYLASEVKGVRRAVARMAPLMIVLPLALAWGLRTLDNPLSHRAVDWDLNWLTTNEGYYSSAASWAPPSGWGWGRTAGLLPRLLGVQPGLLPTVVGVSLFSFPLLFGARPRRRPVFWLPLLTCLATLLFAPQRVFGTDFVFERFSIFLLPFFLFGLRGSPSPRAARPAWLLVALLTGGWTAFVSTRTLAYESEAKPFLAMLAAMEPGERAYSLIFERDSETAIAPTYLHYPVWYSALKGGVVDPSFASTHVELVLYKPESMPRGRVLSLEWMPQWFDWKRFGGDAYRYFLVRAPADVGPFVSRSAPCPVKLLRATSHWWLYERDSSCAPRPASR